MIRRPRGHYIVEELFGRGTVVWCLKCHEDFSSLGGYATRREISEAFDKPCRGTWKKELVVINRLFDQAERRQKRALKWIAFDQKRKKKGKK